jgi:methylmalonyl-CoA mutase
METGLYRPTHNVRFVTAAALFDGHDAAIQEDVQGIAISSYQSGHVEYLKLTKLRNKSYPTNIL